MAKDAAALAKKFRKTATVLPRTNKAAVGAAALASKGIVLVGMAGAGLHPGSKVAGKGVNVNYKLTGDSALLRMTGPVHLVNNPTKPHVVGPRRKRALRFSDGRVRRRANHPGTAGKHFWEPAERRIRVIAPEVMAKTHRSALLREFTGG